MKFNPLTKDLFTDEGLFIKRLRCPYIVDWDEMNPQGPDGSSRTCGICQHPVVDTSTRSDTELMGMLMADPRTCLTLDLEQEDLTITHMEDDQQENGRPKQ